MASEKHLPRIAILGSLNMDLVSYVSKHPAPGETISSNGFDISPGGKGANQAVAVAKLSRSADLTNASATVTMLGAVGADAYGSTMQKGLAQSGIDTAGVRTIDGQQTGVAVIVVEESTGQNRIIVSSNANASLTTADAEGLLQQMPDMLIMQLEIPLETVLHAMELAKVAGVPVVLNPAPAQALPDASYRGLAHLVVNETEAALLTGCAESDLDDAAGLQRVGTLFTQKGVETVIITLGGRGVFYLTAAGDSGLVPAQKVNVVDTTAAGDTFIGSYALSAATAGRERFDIASAVDAANRAAAITVGRKGAQVSIPWQNELS